MPRPAVHPGKILADELAELGVRPGLDRKATFGLWLAADPSAQPLSIITRTSPTGICAILHDA